MPPPELQSNRILLVEDNAGDARFIEELLNESSHPFEILGPMERLEQALQFLDSNSADAILLDLSLPDSTGMETFERLHSHPSGLPIIVLSGLDDEELAVEAVHRGAQDYLLKDQLDPRLLDRSVRYGIERMRSERELALERNLLRELLAKIPDRIYFKDKDSRFILISGAHAKLFGLKRPEDAVGKSDFDFFVPEHARHAYEDEQRILQTGRPLVGRVEKAILPDGHVDWVSTTKMPLHDPEGNIVGTFGISRVITRLKRMEEALNTERLLLHNVIDNLPDPIYLKDREGRYKLDNTAHLEFLGLQDPGELVGKSVFDFFSDEIAQKFHEDDEAIMSSGEPMLYREEPITDSAGNKRWHLTTKVPMRDQDDNIVGLVCIGRDITEQKEAEEKLSEANAHLTSALADLKRSHDELRSVQLQLIEAEKLKSIGRLAAGVAHEVKNPLAIVSMGVEYLSSQTYTDENVPSILDDIRDAVKRADNVIKGLLDFSAPKQLDMRACNLNSVIERALLLTRGEMRQGIHRVETDLLKEIDPVSADTGKMGQVFVNIFTNAYHAMEAGGTLRVRTYTRQLGENGDDLSPAFHAGDRVVVTEVEDEGPGIPDSALEKIFDPFYTTKPTGKGTGLGLSVTKSIVALHRGTIAIANKPTGGAKVTITLRTKHPLTP